MDIEVREYSEVVSTNQVARELAELGAKEGTVVVADIQKGGRGRLNRNWTSPKGGLWFSIIVRPNVSPEYVPQLTLLTANAIVRSLRDIAVHDGINIKWPNDILWNNKKICGILSEAFFGENGKFEYVVIGVGLNVNLQMIDFDRELRSRATSIAIEMNHLYELKDILSYILKHFEMRYEKWKHLLTMAVIPEWIEFNNTLGKRVDIRDGESLIARGTATGISEFGALRVLDDEGNILEFNFGEVSVRESKS